MNELAIIKQFILRKQELLDLIKPFCLIFLFDESKEELLSARKEYYSSRCTENNIMIRGEDTHHQNLIDLTKQFYKSRSEELEGTISSLHSTIKLLQNHLHLDDDCPIDIAKSAYHRRREIDWIFGLVEATPNYVQNKFCRIIKSLIFGELIRLEKSDDDKKIYLSLLCDFKANFEKWEKSWINKELPSEELF